MCTFTLQVEQEDGVLQECLERGESKQHELEGEQHEHTWYKRFWMGTRTTKQNIIRNEKTKSRTNRKATKSSFTVRFILKLIRRTEEKKSTQVREEVQLITYFLEASSYGTSN